MIENIIQSNIINSVITLQKSKEQIEKENYEKIEKHYDNFFKERGFLSSKNKKEYELRNGLKIKNRRQIITKQHKCNLIIAFDTETYKGKCRLLACSEGKHTKINPSFYECIRFLFAKANTSNVYRFFYNIDFDFTSIIKLWNSKNMFHRLRIKWLKDGIEVKYKHKKAIYIIKWIKGRMLSIKHQSRKKSVVFTDIFNFFHTGLNNSSKKYLKDVKINDMDGNLLNTSLKYWKKREKEIIEYCIQDSILTKKLGRLLIDTIKKCELPLPKYLVSSASLSKQDFRSNCYITTIGKVPKKIIQIAFDTYFGGRFEIFERGYFDNLYLYDINSQYPSFIKYLFNLRDGLWKKWKNSTEIPKEQCLGYFLAEVDIPKEYKIPTIPIKHNGVNKFPNGKIKKWLTWYDLDLIRDFIVKIYDGYIFKESSRSIDNPMNTHKPFEKRINELYEQKKKLKGVFELGYNLTKLDMNALYGCFIETHKNYHRDGSFELNAGVMFNSVYASQITAFGRWSVIKDIPRDKYDNIKAIHTDSIISDIPLDKYFIQNDKIGNWNQEGKGKGIILNTGMYQIGYLVKTRGIPKKYIKTWLRFCWKYPNSKKKTFNIKHMRKLSEGLIRDKSLINVNTIMDDERSVNPNSDTKRDWISDFDNFDDVISRNIDSYPYYFYESEGVLHPNPLSVAYRYE